MRIALLTLAVPWDSCPTNGLYNIDQARALAKLGHETQIFSVAPAIPNCLSHLGGAIRRQTSRPDTYRCAGITIHTVRALAAFPRWIRMRAARKSPRLISAWWRRAVERPLLRALDKFQPDAIICHGVMPWGELASAIMHKLDIPGVVIEHSADDVKAVVRCSKLSRHYVDIAKKIQHVFTVNSQMAQDLQHIGVPMVSPLRNGVNMLAEPSPSSGTGGRRSFTVLCAGEYHERKGHAILLESFARADMLGAKLRLVGEPPRKLRSLVAELGIAERVEILPRMPNDALLREMAKADLFALPSWGEAFGLVFMESLGAGTPVLMTSDCGASEFIVHGKHGWIIPPRDITACTLALESAYRIGREQREAMGNHGRHLVNEGFTWSANATNVVNSLSPPASMQPVPKLLPNSIRHRYDLSWSMKEEGALK